MLLMVGLFFTDPIQNVHRWYKIPLIGSAIQPTEYAKLAMILALARFLESRAGEGKKWSVALQAFAIFFVPFLLIMKQPDLGSALILYPVALALFYMGGIHPRLVKGMAFMGLLALGVVLSFFLGFLSHDEMRPYATKVLHEYQYERLSPNTYHQRTAQAAIALGGVSGTGWGRSELTAHSWLPAAHTDSVFAAYAEEFGLMGIGVLLLFFSGLIYCWVQIASFAVDTFGRLLATGGAVFLAMHACINIGMMCGTLPITGVPLLLISYGGSSVLSTMMTLGVLQSIYRRRFVC
jgi:rod shape determining protein RodA